MEIKTCVVMCKTGIRSLEVCKQLKKLGFSRVTNVKGGISSYREKGHVKNSAE